MFKNIFNTKTKLVFLFIVLFELFSIIASYSDIFMKTSFVVFVLLFTLVSLYKLEYGIYIIFIELIIGSKGYLLSYDISDYTISLRIGIWISIMTLWLLKAIIAYYLKNKKDDIFLFFRSWLFKFYFFLGLFLGWGLINAFLNDINLKNIILDFNAWLFFFLALPVFYAVKQKDFLIKFSQISFAAISWVILKTFFLLYIFSHNFTIFNAYIYKWIRNSGVGEITKMSNDFYRIFFQSHIYILIFTYITFFLILYFLNTNKVFNIFKNLSKIDIKGKKDLLLLTFFLSLLMSINILSLSRSNWVGLFFGAIISAIFIIYKFNLRVLLNSIFIFFVSSLFGIIIIICIVKFPLPNQNNSFSATSLLSERTSNISNEAGASSRWSLLPVLWENIKENPIMGKGFGSTVTYKTSDPRILESNPSGMYKTYAFEWGWHDVWLKIGLIGLFAYLLLLFKIFKSLNHLYKNKITKIEDYLYISMAVALLSLMVVHFFSPYLNHPLGIGYVVFISAVLSEVSKKYQQV